MLFDCFCRPVPQLNSGTDATTCKYPLTMPDSLNDLNRRLLAFARERDWEQFHSPKNLSMALAGECGELLEHFQWLSEAQSACLERERDTAHEHRVLYQSILEEKRAQVEESIRSSKRQTQEKQESDLAQARERLNAAADTIFERVLQNGDR